MQLPSTWKWEGERNKSGVSKFVNWFWWHYFGPWVRIEHIFFFRNLDIFQHKGKMEWKQVAVHSEGIMRYSSLLVYITLHYQTYWRIVLTPVRIVMMSVAMTVSCPSLPFYTVIFLQRETWRSCVLSFSSQNVVWKLTHNRPWTLVC